MRTHDTDRGDHGTTLIVYEDLPPSLNAFGSGNRRAYHQAKKSWQGTLEQLLMASGLPRQLAYVDASAELLFPTSRRRDEGNYRFLLEKALGDALVNGGWLPDDTPEEYRFGRVVLSQPSEAVRQMRGWRAHFRPTTAVTIEWRK